MSLLLGLVLLEAGLRVLLGNAGDARILQRSAHDDVCVELRPRTEVTYTGRRARVPATTLRTNSYGLRGPEFAFDKRPGSLRVAAVGGALAFGLGVGEEDAYVAVAAGRLREAGVDAEVLNFGVPGHATPQAVARAERRAVATDPDLVLVSVFPTDFTPERSHCVAGAGAPAWLLRSGAVIRLFLLLADPVLSPKLEPGTIEQRGTPGDRFVASMKRLAEQGRERGFRAAAVLLTDATEFHGSRWCTECPAPHHLVDRTGAHVIDLGPAWRALEDGGDDFIDGDDHLSAAAHRVLGQALGDALASWIRP